MASPAALLALSWLKPGTIETRNTLIVFGSLLSTPPAAAALLRIVLRSPFGRGLLAPGVPVRAKLLLYVPGRNAKATSTPACA